MAFPFSGNILIHFSFSVSAGQHDIRKGTLSHASSVNTEQSATMNGDSSHSGNLSLSCSISSVKIEELEVLEVENCLESYYFR